jgi:hypothetical protein
MPLSSWEKFYSPDQNVVINLDHIDKTADTEVYENPIFIDRQTHLEQIYSVSERVRKLDLSTKIWSTAKRYLALPPLVAAMAINVSGNLDRKDPNTLLAEDVYVAIGAAVLFLAGKGMEDHKRNKATKISIDNVPIANYLRISLPGNMQTHINNVRKQAEPEV